MDVNRTNGGGYQAPAPPPPPMPGSGEFNPAPAVSYAPAPPQQQPVAESRGAERHEREGRDSLRRAVDEINSSIAIYRRHLGVRHHEPSNRRIITVYDSDTNEVIREIPPESVLQAHANMLEMVGLFVNTRG
ncbi:MAG: flagellar protein FlaG [Defluviitaleaceae bacterium]|nr:flagellar protein FlaG [Defluviitaleaceae bacterium]MCL2263120.1 flagellar protein FlaG [Defluviitaleaceae bacterium]